MQLEVSLFVASFFNAIGGDWKALQADSEQAMQVSTYQKVFQVEACGVSIPPAAIFPLTTHLTTAASTPNFNQIHGGKHFSPDQVHPHVLQGCQMSEFPIAWNLSCSIAKLREAIN